VPAALLDAAPHGFYHRATIISCIPLSDPRGFLMSESVRILLIDDDEQAFLATREMLTQVDAARFVLDWVATYDEGKAALESGDYDLYLLDYVLDEGTGLDMLRELGPVELRTPVIMLTGKGDFSVDVEAMQLGIADYLDKGSTDPELLERTVRFALDRHEARRALAESEARHRSMFDHLPIGLFRCTPTGGHLDANPALVRLLGYPDREKLETYAQGFYVGSDDRAHFQAALERLGVVHGFETRLEGRDGRPLKLRTAARVHRDATGEIAYVEGAVEDVTDAWPTVGYYLDAARFQRMFTSGPMGLIAVGIDGVIQNANPCFLRESGYEVGELIETQFTDLWSEEDQNEVRQQLAALGSGRDERSEGVRRFRHRDGSLLSASVTMMLIPDWDETPHHVLVMVADAAPDTAALP
jgi:PAS domain S-box-containing protein